MSDTQLIVRNEVLGVFTQCPGQVAFALELENPSNFREKVLVLCVQAARIARIIPQEGCVWEGDGVLMYKDVYNQYHIYFDSTKYYCKLPACYEDEIGVLAFIPARQLEEVLGFAVRYLQKIAE
ncbi:MAG: hypothetical protein RL292_160 [Candidatus Parcubacteria bacterium]|jgi:hypothetical protein